MVNEIVFVHEKELQLCNPKVHISHFIVHLTPISLSLQLVKQKCKNYLNGSEQPLPYNWHIARLAKNLYCIKLRIDKAHI